MSKILECEYAYKKRGQKAVFCTKLNDEQFAYCGHQKFCKEINGYRTSEFAKNCPLRKKKD